MQIIPLFDPKQPELDERLDDTRHGNPAEFRVLLFP